MGVVNLNDEDVAVDTGNDSIVIVDAFATIRGGRSLDVSGYYSPVLHAGHPIIQDTTSKEYKPMPVTGAPVISFGNITPGSSYTNGAYTNVALTGGSGSGARANIVVAGGKVTSVAITDGGTGYMVGDTLSAAASSVGGTGSGFSVPVTKISNKPSAYASLPSGHAYVGILRASILTKRAFAAILTQGTVNPAAAVISLTSILSALKSALPLIDFRED